MKHDISGVRIHRGAAADASARAVNAVAYTVGQDIVFRDGAFAPETPSGKELLAHELAHVAQQSSGAASAGSTDGLTVTASDDASERDADRVAAAVMRGEGAAEAKAAPPRAGLLQRRVVCDSGGGCWEEPDLASYPEPNASRPPPNMSPASAAPPRVTPAVAATSAAPRPTGPSMGVPLAAGMLTPMLGPGLGPPLPPSVIFQPPPGLAPAVEPLVAEAPVIGEGVAEVAVEGVAEAGAEGLAETAGTGLLEGAIGLASAPVLASLAIGGAILLWSSPTAPPWMDEMNPVTGNPYHSEDEYNLVRRMNPQEREAARRERRQRGTPTVAPDVAPDTDTEEGGNDCFRRNPYAMFCTDAGPSAEAQMLGRARREGIASPVLVNCRQDQTFGAGAIEACSGAPGYTMHCDVQGTDLVISIFACSCCRADGTSGYNWEEAHVSTYAGQRGRR